jgi:hypothetical protein
MRHAGLLLALLAAATQLPACATTGSPDARKGQSGSVNWEIVDIKQTLTENGYRMRWDFTVVLRNTGDIAVNFERVEKATRAGGSVDSISGGMSTVPYKHRLEPAGELRVRQGESWGCSPCAPGHLPRFFSDGIIVYYTLFGRDAAGSDVRVPIALRLNSSVGERN